MPTPLMPKTGFRGGRQAAKMPGNCSTTWRMPQPVKAVCSPSAATAVCGSGRLDASATWVAVAGEAHTAYSHTGHAVYLHSDGSVLGTGGNLAGPLDGHGYGDKAVAEA